MVSAAVCVLIMAILATVFQLSIDTMRQMKSTGDLMTQLRAAGEVVKRDLQADHFAEADNKNKLSDQSLDKLRVDDTMPTNPPPPGTPGRFVLRGWSPPANGGFFRIKSTPAPLTPTPGSAAVTEGQDGDGLLSSRATDHYLHFTSVLELGDQNAYTASVPGRPGTLTSRAAEIAYFLEPTPSGYTSGTGSTPLYHLIRRQRLLAATGNEQAAITPATNPITQAQFDAGGKAVVNTLPRGTTPQTYFISTLADLNDPSRATLPTLRLGRSFGAGPTTPADDTTLASISQNASMIGDDILISNVISFEVKVQWDSPLPAASDTLPSSAYPRPSQFVPGTTTDTPFDYLPNSDPTMRNGSQAGPYVFDTWGPIGGWNNVDQTTGRLTGGNVPPLAIRVKAVQLRIRVYDPKLKNTRQITIVQDL